MSISGHALRPEAVGEVEGAVPAGFGQGQVPLHGEVVLTRHGGLAALTDSVARVGR